MKCMEKFRFYSNRTRQKNEFTKLVRRIVNDIEVLCHNFEVLPISMRIQQLLIQFQLCSWTTCSREGVNKFTKIFVYFFCVFLFSRLFPTLTSAVDVAKRSSLSLQRTVNGLSRNFIANHASKMLRFCFKLRYKIENRTDTFIQYRLEFWVKKPKRKKNSNREGEKWNVNYWENSKVLIKLEFPLSLLRCVSW